MAIFEIRFKWEKCRNGYRFEEGQRGELRIVRNKGELETYEPLNIAGMYKVFSNCSSNDDLLGFINKYGPLTAVGNDLALPTKSRERTVRGKKVEVTQVHIGEDVRELQAQLSWFKSVLQDKKQGVSVPRVIAMRPSLLRIAQTRVGISRGELAIVFCPDSLLHALRLQLILAIVGAEKLIQCQYCQMPFAVGVGTGKRIDAKFCCDDHRVRFNSRARSIP